MPKYKALKKFYLGKVIHLDLKEFTHDAHDLDNVDEEVLSDHEHVHKNDSIEFIRAKYGRNCAVTKNGRVFFWGQGFRNEKIEKPKLFFIDCKGIKDL